MIYFVTARDIGRVKIGYSADPFGRFSKIQSDNPSRLTLEAIEEGDKADERVLHQRFAAWQVQGEWFQLAQPIQSHIESLSKLNHCHLRRESKIAALMSAAGCSYSYAAKMLGGHRQITIPVAISVYRFGGGRIGPLVNATDHEIDILEKFCGRFEKKALAA